MIIVLLKILLSNVTILGALNNDKNGATAPTDIEDIKPADETMPPRNINLCRHLSSLTGNTRSEDADSTDKTLEELNAIRTREITSKAISAFILIILKWFRLSRWSAP